MFTAAQRDAVRDELVAFARADSRITACALVGSSATGEDRWSDVDIALGVAAGVGVTDALAGWTTHVADRYGADVLFDLPFGPTTYRVFLLASNLQVDVSMTPAGEFAATSPRFRLVFGTAGTRAMPERRPVDGLVGLAAHHALRARVSIERGRPWQAEFWLHELRDEALTVACRLAGVPDTYGRGFDDLEPAVRDAAAMALPGDLGRDELLRALGAGVELLLAVSAESSGLARRLAERLRELGTTAAS